VFASGERIAIDFRLPTPEGPRWLSGRLMLEPGDERGHVILSFTDVTERVNREAEQAALRRVATVVAREADLEEIGRVLTWPATQEQIEKAMGLVPDDVVQLVTASGGADECRAKVQEYVDAGCTCPVLYPLGDDVPAMIEAFAAVRV